MKKTNSGRFIILSTTLLRYLFELGDNTHGYVDFKCDNGCLNIGGSSTSIQLSEYCDFETEVLAHSLLKIRNVLRQVMAQPITIIVNGDSIEIFNIRF